MEISSSSNKVVVSVVDVVTETPECIGVPVKTAFFQTLSGDSFWYLIVVDNVSGLKMKMFTRFKDASKEFFYCHYSFLMF